MNYSRKTYWIAGSIGFVLFLASILIPKIQQPLLIVIGSVTLFFLYKYTKDTGELTKTNQELLLNDNLPSASCKILDLNTSNNEIYYKIKIISYTKFMLEAKIQLYVSIFNLKTKSYETIGLKEYTYFVQPYVQELLIYNLQDELYSELRRRASSDEISIWDQPDTMLICRYKYKRMGSSELFVEPPIEQVEIPRRVIDYFIR